MQSSSVTVTPIPDLGRGEADREGDLSITGAVEAPAVLMTWEIYGLPAVDLNGRRSVVSAFWDSRCRSYHRSCRYLAPA